MNPACPENPAYGPLVRNGHRFDGFFRIRHADKEAGFCALVTYALNGVRRALGSNLLPVIDYTNHEVNPFFYDPQHGENVWDYYFETVMGVSADELDQYLSTGEIPEEMVHEDPMGVVLERHRADPERIATFWAFSPPADPPDWMAEKRELGREFVQRFIRVKPHIDSKVAAFHQEFLGGFTVCGVHVRGTDFAYADPTPLKDYFGEIHRLDEDPDTRFDRIFLATDQVQFVDAFRKEFGDDRVVTYLASRSDDDVPAFLRNDVSPYLKGEDVLIDVLLLSRSDYLLKGAAAVGEFALWFNPGLDCTDFALDSQFDFTSSGSAFLRMNVGNAGIFKWRFKLFVSSITRTARRIKRPLLDAVMKFGRRIFPKPLKDFLWQKFLRHIY